MSPSPFCIAYIGHIIIVFPKYILDVGWYKCILVKLHTESTYQNAWRKFYANYFLESYFPLLWNYISSNSSKFSFLYEYYNDLKKNYCTKIFFLEGMSFCFNYLVCQEDVFPMVFNVKYSFILLKVHKLISLSKPSRESFSLLMSFNGKPCRFLHEYSI